jgi:hypothetical protein
MMWIGIYDEKPPYEKMVLLYSEYSHWELPEFGYRQHSWQWDCDEYRDKDGNYLSAVTHWMPIPELPNDTEDDGNE